MQSAICDINSNFTFYFCLYSDVQALCVVNVISLTYYRRICDIICKVCYFEWDFYFLGQKWSSKWTELLGSIILVIFEYPK